MSSKLIVGAERDAALTDLAKSGKWSLVKNRDAIESRFEFTDFRAAFAFMTQVALHADRADHHPEWCNVYNRVHVTLSTHDCNGLSRKDVDLALFAVSVCASMRGCQKK